MRYGDLKFTKEVIGNFEANLDVSVKQGLFEKIFTLAKDKKEVQLPNHATRTYSSVDSRDALMHHLYAKVSTTKGHKVHLDLNAEITRRMRVDHVFEDFSGVDEEETQDS